MRHEDAYEWLEETPWWKKTIKWFGWLALSLIVAAGFADAPFFVFFGFVCAWCFRSLLTIEAWGIFGWFATAVTIGGVSLFLINIVGPADQSFWYGFALAAALLGAIIILQLRKLKFTKETLHHEIYLTGFEWYRNQKLERDHKEYDEWLKKHPNQ